MAGDTNRPPILLWIDLRTEHSPCELESSLSSYCRIHRETRVAAILDTILEIAPEVLCFDYDYPDRAGLQALRETKCLHPSLPILMFTEQHSESLAIWAFRTGVRDYLVKPIRGEDIRTRIEIFSNIRSQNRDVSRYNCLPSFPIPAEMCFGASMAKRRSTLPAVAYVEAHFYEKITLDLVGRLCRMNSFQLSRVFRQEHGLTFREFLIRYRIHKARALLSNPHASVAEVAFAVGFRDPSHFAQMFRRYLGANPSEYRQRRRPR